jgi:hypothetical protein
MRRTSRLLAFTTSCLLALCLGGCRQDHDDHDHAAAAAPAVASIVEWPAVRELDELAHRAGAAADGGDVAALRAMLPDLNRLAKAAATDAIPGNARNAVQVEMLQLDLENLADALADPAALADEDLHASVEALHPVIEGLMLAAGLPHVHGSQDDHGHDHDHGDHSHDHEH